ncbi:hypothetical protein ACF0H5_023689 [Mactra antiquata]
MSQNLNANEAGWFYHAPARRTITEPVGYPAMSQVPGLCDDDGQVMDDPPKPLFRDTDTKYIRLAKQGGRANLLQIKENSDAKREPVGYPRNEWFYLADNAMEDEAERKKNEIPYDFLRPEYMVHEPYKADPQMMYERPQRGPLAFDKLSIFEREPGNSAADKTVKLPELKKHGYGVRSGKQSRAPRNKPSSAQTDPGKGPRPLKYLSLPEDEDEEKPKMRKILNYEYEREWQEKLKTWQENQEIGRKRHQQMTNIPSFMDEQKIESEYNITYGKRSAAVHFDLNRQNTQQSSRPSEGKSSFVRQNETQRLREARLQKPTPKDPFKMTRFKNVPARIDSHRPLQSQPVV